MHKSTRLIKLLPIILIAVSSCGYDGKYRYECQDPVNWEKEECNPPICEVDGACTKTLLGWDPSETTVETIPVEETTAP
jgi:hypothetical protein